MILLNLLMMVILISEKQHNVIKENSEILIKWDGKSTTKYDPKIAELQKELISKGYDLGNYGPNKDGVDGIYGPLTKAADEKSKSGVEPSEFNKTSQLYDTSVDDSKLEKEFNFHKIPDGKNNYRSAQLTPELIEYVIKKYNIKNIIRLNGDGSDAKHRSSHPITNRDVEKKVCEQNGCNFYPISSHSGYKVGEGYVTSVTKVKSIMDGGNTLIHCAHGADRTGGMVGGYLKRSGIMTNPDELWKYTTQYNSWNSMLNGGRFFGSGYDKYADSFYPISDLKKKSNKVVSEKVSDVNVIIGDSQTPFVDTNTTKAKRILELCKGGVGVNWLRDKVMSYPVTPSVQNVILVIGTNGTFGRNSNDDISGLFKAINKTFPNGRVLVVQGSWGWSKNNTNVDLDFVRRYYKKYENLGGIIIDPPIGNIEPHQNHRVYNIIGNNLDKNYLK